METVSLQVMESFQILAVAAEERGELKTIISKKLNVSGHWSGLQGIRVSLVLSLIKQALQMRGRLDEMKVSADSAG